MSRAYMSKKTLADHIDRSESTIDDWVRRGIIPQPIRPGGGDPLWRWEDVDLALRSYAPGQGGGDPYSLGVRNATQAAKSSRNAA